MNRRNFLQYSALALALTATRRSWAIGENSLLQLGQLRLGPNWEPRPSALARLAREAEKRTSIPMQPEARMVTLSDPDLHRTPILYLAGDREFPMPSEPDLLRLRRFLTFGGFLIIDNAEGKSDGAFDSSVQELLTKVFPGDEGNLRVVPPSHVVFKSFYLLERAVGRVATAPALLGIERDRRLAVTYVKNDMGGAWARDDFGNWDYPCKPGGEDQREKSFRMGINLLMYALCLDYKEDQVHVDFIMKRRKWRPNDGAEIPNNDD